MLAPGLEGMVAKADVAVSCSEAAVGFDFS